MGCIKARIAGRVVVLLSGPLGVMACVDDVFSPGPESGAIQIVLVAASETSSPRLAGSSASRTVDVDARVAPSTDTDWHAALRRALSSAGSASAKSPPTGTITPLELEPELWSGRTGAEALPLVQRTTVVGGGRAAASPTQLDAVRAMIEGPTPVTVELTRAGTGNEFTGTAEKLQPGSYSVTVLGFVAGELEHYGYTSGVTVEKGKTAAATIPFPSFVPTLRAIPSLTTQTTVVLALQTAVPRADSIIFESSTTSAFTSPARFARVPADQLAIGFLDAGTLYVRARAKNNVAGLGRASTAQSVTVQYDATDRPTRDQVYAFGYGTDANGRWVNLNILPRSDVDAFVVGICGGDRLSVRAAAATLTTPSFLDPVVIILNPDLTVLASDDDGGGNLESLAAATSSQAGLHAIGVGAAASASTSPLDRRVGHYELVVSVSLASPNGDLVPLSVTGPASATSGSSISVSTTIENRCPGTIPAGWDGDIRLSTNNVISSADILLATFTAASSLAPGARLTFSGSVPLSGVSAGTYYLGVRVDVNSEVGERSGTNNSLASASTISVN